MKIYVASSWRNAHQPNVVAELRGAGHDVYDFRNPAAGVNGFSWAEIDPNWQAWTTAQYLTALDHPFSRRGFKFDWAAMCWADAGVLVMPCGRSAHIEAGYFVGANKPLYILIPHPERAEPELMYRMADGICTHMVALKSMITDRFTGGGE